MSGILSLTSSSQYPITINGSNDGKIVLRGSSNPYITFRESNTDKGYLQWHSDGYLKFKNHEDASSIRIKDTIDFSTDDSTWHTVWHAGNDGTGSGLDADTLDGVQGASYLRSDTSDSFTSGTLSIHNMQFQAGNVAQNLKLKGNNGTDVGLSLYTSQNTWTCQLYGTSGSYGFLNSNWGAWDLKKVPNGQLELRISSTLQTVWHTGNDGSGSGLDADLLDGKQDTQFVRSDEDDTCSANLTFSQDGANGFLTTAGGTTFHNVGGSSSKKLVLRNLAELRFQDGADWNYNEWAGIKFVTSTDTMYIGGPASNNFTNNGGAASIDVNFVGLNASGLKKDGNTVWHAGNDGAGSGLDADLLDGVQGASYLRSDADDTYTGDLIINGIKFGDSSNTPKNLKLIAQGGGAGDTGISMYDQNGAWCFQVYGTSNGYYGFLDANWASWDIRKAVNGELQIDAGSGLQTVWHQGNDGAGSGLDADTLDGNQASAFPTLSGSNSFTNGYNEFGNSTGSVSNDGGWNARLNLAGSSHARFDVKSVSDGIITSVYAHTGHAAGKVGTMSNHSLKFVVNANDRATLTSAGSLSTTSQGTLWGASNDGSGSGLDADTLDGRDTSSSATANTVALRDGNGYLFASYLWATSGDRAGTKPTRFHASDDQYIRYYDGNYMRMWLGQSYKTSNYARKDSTTDSNYWVGAYGWGTTSMNNLMGKGNVFWDTWSNPSGQPSGTSHWTGFNCLHYTNRGNDGTSSGGAYGWQMTMGAGNPSLTYLRGNWNSNNLGTPTWYKVWNEANDGSGSGLDADLLDGKHDTSFLRSDAGGGAGSYGADLDITFNGGAGAVTIGANSDIRLTNGNWTGDHAGKIQHHSNYLYLQGGSNGLLLRASNGTNTMLSTASSINSYVDHSFQSGAGAVTIAAHSDIRFTSGNWTGESMKIQGHSNWLYIQGGSNGHVFRRSNGNDAWYINSSGALYSTTSGNAAMLGIGVAPGTSGNPFNNLTKKIAIGDNDSGFAQESDGIIGFYGNGQKRGGITVDGLMVTNQEGADAALTFECDEGDDNADKWQIVARTDGQLRFQGKHPGDWRNAGYFNYNSSLGHMVFRGPAGGLRYDDNINSPSWSNYSGDGQAHRSNGQAYHTADDHFRIRRNGGSENKRFDLRTDTGHGQAQNDWQDDQFDFAEFFEWSDGNPSGEDRIGHTVTVDGLTGKIKIAEDGDAIIGVVSGTAAFTANCAAMGWHGKYIRDEWGRYRFDLMKDEDGNQLYRDINNKHEKITLVENPDWDESIEYYSREERKEWDKIGIIGQCYVRKTAVKPSSWIKLKEIDSVKDFYLIK
tara:strand:- start:543 stop:4511 length:3969 start_codon:yes stop_codon:yes gene_type:complete